ncbi:MAG: restriction endonuclease subunit S [Bacteroidia bacterium]|nr:restriction endonuclease subunit S [Bacteroidia bacterium]
MKMQQNKLPKGWEIKRLGEICDLSAGGDVPKGNYSDDKTEQFSIPIYANGEKNDGLYGYTDIVKVSKPSITISARGTIGFSLKRIEPFYPIVRLIVATPKNLDNLSLEFLNYGIKNIDFKHSGTSIPQLTVPMIRNYEIPLPPLPEQQRIVSILDEAFAAIAKVKANAEQNLKNARELFESSLKQVFEVKGNDWEEKLLKDIALQFGRGKSKHRPRNWAGLFNGKYPFIQTGDVRNASKYVNDFSQTYNEVGLAQSKLWHKGTICITIAANIAETAILGFNACFPDSIIGLQVNPQKADLDFTYYLLQYFKSELQKLGKGSAQDNINLGTFENKLFPFPKSLEKQQEIVKTLNTLLFETQKLEGIYQQKLQNLEEMRKSILQKAFNGEL